MQTLNISQIIQLNLPSSQYYRVKHVKNQIVLHHTAGGPTAESVLAWWKRTPARIATAFIIDRKGVIYQCFHSSYWAHHLGTKLKNNTLLNQQSIGIELCCWGGLTEHGDEFYSYTGTEIPKDEIVSYPQKFRGYYHFQCYTHEQLESLQSLVVYLCEKYKIPKFLAFDKWDTSKRATSGKPGIFTHINYRKDKSDCHPQIDLITKLLEL